MIKTFCKEKFIFGVLVGVLHGLLLVLQGLLELSGVVFLQQTLIFFVQNFQSLCLLLYRVLQLISLPLADIQLFLKLNSTTSYLSNLDFRSKKFLLLKLFQLFVDLVPLLLMLLVQIFNRAKRNFKWIILRLDIVFSPLEKCLGKLGICGLELAVVPYIPEIPFNLTQKFFICFEKIFDLAQLGLRLYFPPFDIRHPILWPLRGGFAPLTPLDKKN